MRDIAPAVRRIAKIEAQIAALQDKRDKEDRRIRFAGRVEAEKALARAGIVKGQTVVADARGRDIGLFERLEVQTWPRGSRATYWWFLVHYRTIRKDGRLGTRRDYRGFQVDHPRDLADQLRIVEQRVAPCAS